MKRRYFILIFALVVLLSLLPTVILAAEDAPWEGRGTRTNPYLISTREDLDALAAAVNNGEDQKGVYFRQTNDIEMGDAPFEVIGHVIANAPHPFNGVYDGADFEVQNLYVSRKEDDASLFGFVGPNGVLRRVHVVNCEIHGSTYVAGVAGRNYGLVEYCSSTGEIYGSWQYAGGIVGYNQYGGIISYCYSETEIYGNQFVGGIAGSNSASTIVNCYFRGYAEAKSNVRSYVGGIVGENRDNSTVDNCYSDGEVYGPQYAGAIAGSNGLGSSVEDCFYQQDSDDDTPGISDNKGYTDNVIPKTEEEFESGEVAWELSQGTNGDGWGQTLDRGEGEDPDHHPHFVGHVDTSPDTTPVYRVTFKYYADSDTYDYIQYVDPDVNVPEPAIPSEYPHAAWYEYDEGDDKRDGGFVLGTDGLPVFYDGVGITRDINAVAGQRSWFRAETDQVTVTWTYSPDTQTVSADLEQFIEYDTWTASGKDNFTYTITGSNTLNAALTADKKTFIVPADSKVGEYELTVTAAEIMPQIVPLSAVKPGSYGTDDVTLTVKVVIDKATPDISVTADAIDYGRPLNESRLTGTATRPGTENTVAGSFAWVDPGTVPNVRQAESIGYPVLFVPDDTQNYNTVTAMVRLDIITHEPTFTPPTPINSVYNGMAENLIIPGSAQGGTMKYWIEGDSSDYSSTIPSRANVGTYTIWYMVVGDEGYSDTEPRSVTATISPVELTIPDLTFLYNGGSTFTVTLKGVAVDGEDGSRNVVATLTASGKNAGSYTYSSAPGAGRYTVELSNSNYVVKSAGTLTVEPIPVVLQWSGPLTFVHDGKAHSVTAEVVNGLEGESFRLTYADNEKTDVGSYTAAVTDLGNNNYTLVGGQNVEQPWGIFMQSDHVTLTADPEGTQEAPLTYGDPLTLTVTITPELASRLLLMTAAQDRVEFFINRQSVGTAPVIYSSDGGVGTATLALEATSAKYFSIGANSVRAEFSGNVSLDAGMDAMTVYVVPKPITAKITGNTSKIYDGHDTAVGLDIELESGSLEECDVGQVFVTAEGYTYNSANVTGANTITACNVTLSGPQSGNYVISAAVTAHGKIEPKTVKLEWRGATGLVYSGEPANVNATATELIPGDTCEVTVVNGDRINAGSYTAVAAGLSNPNYQLPGENTEQEYTIARAPLYIPALTVPYTGENQFTVEVDGINEKIRIRLTASSPEIGLYDYSAAPGDGLYTAYEANGNYEIAGGAVLTIEAGDPSDPSYPIVPNDPDDPAGPGTDPTDPGTLPTDPWTGPADPGADPSTPAGTPSDDVPQTGDNSYLPLWTALMALSAVGMVGVSLLLQRKLTLYSTNGKHMKR